MAQERELIEVEKKWNVEALYPSLDAWNEEFKHFSGQQFELLLQPFQGKLHLGSEHLFNLLETLTNLERTLYKLYTYAHLRHDEDVGKVAHKEVYDKISMLAFKLDQAASWIQPEILHMPEATLEKYLKDPALESYGLYLKKIIRFKPHTLSKEEERLIAQTGKALDTAREAFSLFNNADLKFEPIRDQEGKMHELTHGSYSLYMQSKDRELRKGAFLNLHQGYERFENTVASLLQGQIQAHLFYTQAKHYSSSLEAALFPHQIDTDVYHNLILSVRKALPALHRYVSLRKKWLGVDELHPYDMQVSCVENFEYKVDYDKAREILLQSVAPLGKEYQDILRKGLYEDRWVDPFENIKKRSGAYSSGCYDSFPYILMNFHSTLNDLMTLSHEAGHSMHSYYSRREQPYIYSSYPIFVAEVASTFNEELTFRYLLEHSQSKKETLYLINQKIDGIRATFFRQVMFAEFELWMHQMAEQQVPLTPTLMKEHYLKLQHDYFGEDFKADPELSFEFLRIPHFYSCFYVYQYATGISAAFALVEKVLESKDASAYLKFLSSGSSDYPLNLLKKAGVDMHTPEAIELLVKRFSELVTRLDQELSNKN